MMAAKLAPRNFLSTALTPNWSDFWFDEGTILVSCSGTIGNVAICTRDFHQVAVSQHAIRVDPTADIDRGVLYAFLLSELGQFLITRNKSGSVIESIYAATSPVFRSRSSPSPAARPVRKAPIGVRFTRKRERATGRGE